MQEEPSNRDDIKQSLVLLFHLLGVWNRYAYVRVCGAR